MDKHTLYTFGYGIKTHAQIKALLSRVDNPIVIDIRRPGSNSRNSGFSSWAAPGTIREMGFQYTSNGGVANPAAYGNSIKKYREYITEEPFAISHVNVLVKNIVSYSEDGMAPVLMCSEARPYTRKNIQKPNCHRVILADVLRSRLANRAGKVSSWKIVHLRYELPDLEITFALGRDGGIYVQRSDFFDYAPTMGVW